MQDELIAAEPWRIPLRRRRRDGAVCAYTLVDAVDYERLARWTWRLHAEGYAVRYETRAGKSRRIYMHRVILGLAFGDPRQGDHIDHLAKLDNRRSNLRIAPRGQADNLQNQGSRGGTSQYRGVSWAKRERKWRAYACVYYKNHHLGYFDDEHEAAAVAAAFRAQHMPFSDDA
jgi:hypothetical protein